MIRDSLRAPGLARVAAFVMLGLAPGCAADAPREAPGVAIRPPSGWTAEAARDLPVPGTRLAGWAGPDGSLIVYRTLPIPGGTPKALAREMATRLEHMPGLEIVSAGPAQVGGREVARVEVLAPGDGRSLAPSGLGRPLYASGFAPVPTRRIVLGLPRPTETLWIVWHRPEAKAPGGPDFDSVARSIAFEAESPRR